MGVKRGSEQYLDDHPKLKILKILLAGLILDPCAHVYN
jgi:hypothetical protein